MLYYLVFWTILGFIFHFYIIFGTNLLTGGPAQNCCFFACFRVSKKRNIKRSPNGMKPSETWFSHKIRSRRLGPSVKKAMRWSRGWRPPCLMGPSKLHRRNSTAATFCIHEIPSWGLFQSSAGGGIDHGGLLHHHPSPSDEVWVVYFRPTGP